jgi:hypothetical protein
MAYYVVTYEGKKYASFELYRDAIAGGERPFVSLIAEKRVKGRRLLDEMVFLMTPEALGETKGRIVEQQDLDASLRGIRGYSGEDIETGKVKEVRLHKGLVPATYNIGDRNFIKLRDYPDASRYRMTSQLAALRLCGCWYVALDAVNRGAEHPLVVTLAS